VTAGPVIRAASGGITRRLVQTAWVFMVLEASTAAALLGLTLVTPTSCSITRSPTSAALTWR
jgi:hypothetical protein